MTAPLDKTAAVRDGEELDAVKLRAYLDAKLPELSGELLVEQFPSGFSNLTYLLRLGDRELVLRRPPVGNRIKSAHDMGREFRVLDKLSAVYELAPRPLVSCEDDEILGAPFYVMERRTGIILRKTIPEGVTLDPPTLRGLSEAFIDNLAALHAIDYEAVGLGELGRPEGYIARQVAGWTKRYQAARTDEIPEMEQLAAWLATQQPAESGTALIHNDYKYDNLILDRDDLTRIIAVLDWEMCTLGDPLMDLGMSLAYWVQADDDSARKHFITGPTYLPGNLTRQELVVRYAEKSGRDPSGILFHYCFGLFKLAVIVQQIYARYAAGHTQDPRFANLNDSVANLGIAAVHATVRGRIDSSG